MSSDYENNAFNDEIENESDKLEIGKYEEISLEQQIDILQGKLARRNALFEDIRIAYYRDVITIKENFRGRSTDGDSHNADLSSIPSIDLRDTLQLFAPEKLRIRIQACKTCGGQVELVHTETKQVNEAKAKYEQAIKSEQNMKTIAHRLRKELEDSKEISGALQQRVRALMKENAFTLEELQSSRKIERDQKTVIVDLKKKLTLSNATQDQLHELEAQIERIEPLLKEASNQRDILQISNEEMCDEIKRLKEMVKKEKTQNVHIEVELDECKQSVSQLSSKLSKSEFQVDTLKRELKKSLQVCHEKQASLKKCQNELENVTKTFEETKRYMEDQLQDEENQQEEIAEKLRESQRTSFKLKKKLENLQCLVTEKEQKLLIQETQQKAYLNEQKWELSKQYNEKRKDVEQIEMRMNELETILAFMKVKAPTRRRVSIVSIASTKKKRLSTSSKNPSPSKSEVQSTSSENNVADIDALIVKKDSTDNNIDCESNESESDEPSDSLSSDEQNDKLNNDSSANTAEYELLISNLEVMVSHTERQLRNEEEKNHIMRNQIAAYQKKIKGLQLQLDDLQITLEATQDEIKQKNIASNRSDKNSAEVQESLQKSKAEIDQLQKKEKRYSKAINSMKENFAKITKMLSILSGNESLGIDHISEEIPTEISHDEEESNANIEKRKLALKIEMIEEKNNNSYIQYSNTMTDMVESEMKKIYEIHLTTLNEFEKKKRELNQSDVSLQAAQVEEANLKMTIEIKKNDCQRAERLLKITKKELDDINAIRKCEKEEREAFNVEIKKFHVEKRALTLEMMEKAKALDRECDQNRRLHREVKSLCGELEKNKGLKEHFTEMYNKLVEDEKIRLETNVDIGISAIPSITEMYVQTDPWKPQGLVLRQKNSKLTVPQRYHGRNSVMITCPSLDSLVNTNSVSTAEFRPSTTGSQRNKSSNELKPVRIFQRLPQVTLARQLGTDNQEPLTDNFFD